MMTWSFMISRMSGLEEQEDYNYRLGSGILKQPAIQKDTGGYKNHAGCERVPVLQAVCR